MWLAERAQKKLNRESVFNLDQESVILEEAAVVLSIVVAGLLTVPRPAEFLARFRAGRG